MAGKIRAIKGRIRAVGKIQRITKTMSMIATARFQAMQKRAVSAKPYTRKIQEVVGELAGILAAEGEVQHPLLTGSGTSAGRDIMLVISSNRGFCGGYNAHVLRAALAKARQIKAEGREVEPDIVGKKGVGFAKFNKLRVANAYIELGEDASYAQVEKLAEQYMAAFTGGACDAVYVVYTSYISLSRQKAELIRLLPLEPPEGSGESAEHKAGKYRPVYEFSPGAADLLADLLPVTVKTTLYQCFNESYVSEQIARMVAMKAATDAAVKMGKSLTRSYNRARQSAITTELTEIIGGAAALE